MHIKKRVKPPPGKTGDYHALWKLVDGAVEDALTHHPDYLGKDVRRKVVRNSINKRVVGAVLGYAKRRGALVEKQEL